MPRKVAGDEAYPPIFLEALAYHEAGHAVMAVLFEMPIRRVSIGPACRDPGFNGRVELEIDPMATDKTIPAYKFVLLTVASEPAEKLSPRFEQFGKLHTVCRHLKPFARGMRSDLAQGFNAISDGYSTMGYAKSTALSMFKREYRDLAHRLFEIEVNRMAACRLAEALQSSFELVGEETRTIALAGGPLSDGGLLAKYTRARTQA